MFTKMFTHKRARKKADPEGAGQFNKFMPESERLLGISNFQRLLQSSSWDERKQGTFQVPLCQR